MTLPQSFRENRWIIIAISFLVGVVGVFMGPVIMTPAYEALQPALGSMAVVILEILFALLIDFPLSVVVSVIVCRLIKSRNPLDGVWSTLIFLPIFFGSILLCMALSKFSHLLSVLALNDVFPLSLQVARESMGDGTMGLMVTLYLVFDIALCSLGGLIGYYFYRAFSRTPSD